MTMRKKVLILVYFLIIFCVAGAVYSIVTHIDKIPVTTLTPEELGDTTIAQYKERPSANSTILVQAPSTTLTRTAWTISARLSAKRLRQKTLACWIPSSLLWTTAVRTSTRGTGSQSAQSGRFRMRKARTA